MSIENIFSPLEKLISLHQTLNELSLQKTSVLKKGSIDELRQILIKERKVIQSVDSTEKMRHKAVNEWMKIGSEEKEGTVTELLKLFPNQTDREKLANFSTLLTEEITQLKQNEQLNHALLEQSLQYVQVSLDLMNPTLNNMNYGQHSRTYSDNRSSFDSRA